jgi:hypothetical protein
MAKNILFPQVLKRSLPLKRVVQLLTIQKQKNLKFEVFHASPACFSSKSVVEDGRRALVE